MKRTIILFAISLFIYPAFAQFISLEEAQKVSSNYLLEKGIFSESKGENLKLMKSKSTGEQPAYYVFKTGKQGFIIVSGSKKTYPVLAYSVDQDLKSIRQ